MWIKYTKCCVLSIVLSVKQCAKNLAQHTTLYTIQAQSI